MENLKKWKDTHHIGVADVRGDDGLVQRIDLGRLARPRGSAPSLPPCSPATWLRNLPRSQP